MKIGILQTGLASDEMRTALGEIDHLFHDLLSGQGFEFQTWRVCEMDFPETVEDAGAWIITGSKHGVYEDLPWIPPLERFIRTAHAHKRRIVGICFGHQIVAQALGGRVEKFDGGWTVGRQTYDWQGEPVHLNAWHQDQVVERPRDATLLASSPSCENAALVYGDTILTIQAHPEFSGRAIECLIAARAGTVPPPLISEATAHLDAPTDRHEIGAKMARFLKRGELA